MELAKSLKIASRSMRKLPLASAFVLDQGVGGEDGRLLSRSCRGAAVGKEVCQALWQKGMLRMEEGHSREVLEETDH